MLEARSKYFQLWTFLLNPSLTAKTMFETVKIQQHGEQQLLALPERFRINDDTVYIKRVGSDPLPRPLAIAVR
jgi:hypothetical protein